MAAGPKRLSNPATYSREELAMPSWLPETLRAIWEETIPALGDQVVLQRIDTSALADLVQCTHRLRQAEEVVERIGILVKGAKGNAVKNPAVQLAREYRQALFRWYQMFGIQPNQRIAAKTPVDPLAAHKAAQAGLAEERVQ